MENRSQKKQRGSRQLWLDAAYDLLINGGIDAVKVMPLAKSLGQSRTSFYWFFEDLAELQGAMIERWQDKNTGAILRACEMPAGSVTDALFNLMDCWLNPSIFDSRLDLAVRNWARIDGALQAKLDEADRVRIKAIESLFSRFGYSDKQSEVRGMTVYYTQVGYISMLVEEEVGERLERVQQYVELFASKTPQDSEIAAFIARNATPVNHAGPKLT